MLMIAGDLLAVTITLWSAILIRHAFAGDFELSLYWHLFGMVGLFAASYAWFGLYPGIAYNAVRELRQLTLATTLVFIGLATLSFLFKDGREYSRVVFLVGWLLSLVLVPLVRLVLRTILGHRSWWAYPVAIFGEASAASIIAQSLLKRPEQGFRPAAIFADTTVPSYFRPGQHLGVGTATPVFSGFHHAPLYAPRMGLKHAIIAVPNIDGRQMTGMLESYASMFSRIFVMPPLDGLSSLGIGACDICDKFALEVRRSLLSPGCQFIKRLTDHVIAFVLGILLMPVMVVLAIIIRIESKGPIFYGHKRIGFGGRQFKLWKLRTMYVNGNSILEEYLLTTNPEEREAWASNRKLHHDPRVTRVGRLLRKTSLDELPQLWNVLRGEMSLVGPRPIVNEEVPHYADFFELYCRVMPGLTGLWQVSGRSTTSYERRVELDSFYVRNWSPWFDIYLLARTVTTVLKGDGAY
jgi:Undecaprenyl-phosphate galactose phosphotransferase WbaP